MCFSAEADLIGGTALALLGIDALRHVRRRRDHVALAALPLLLAAHQMDEAFVWWSLQGRVSPTVGQIATWIYLVFAFLVLPVYLPAAVLALEPVSRRRTVMIGFLALGSLVSILLLYAMLRGPVTVALGQHHLRYGIGVAAGFWVVAGYVAATCGAAAFSGYRRLALFGGVNLFAVALLARLAIDGFTSLWCAWAAVTAGAIALHLRSVGPARSLTSALT